MRDTMKPWMVEMRRHLVLFSLFFSSFFSFLSFAPFTVLARLFFSFFLSFFLFLIRRRPKGINGGGGGASVPILGPDRRMAGSPDGRIAGWPDGRMGLRNTITHARFVATDPPAGRLVFSAVRLLFHQVQPLARPLTPKYDPYPMKVKLGITPNRT